MDLKKKYHIVQTIIWAITIISLFVIIIINKSEKEYRYFTYIFYSGYMIVPLLLTLSQIYFYYRFDIGDNSIYAIIPFVSKIILLLFAMISFIDALKLTGKIIIFSVIILICLYNLYAIYILRKKGYKLNLFTILTVISLLLLFAFLIVGVYVSWNYSVKW